MITRTTTIIIVIRRRARYTRRIRFLDLVVSGIGPDNASRGYEIYYNNNSQITIIINNDMI